MPHISSFRLDQERLCEALPLVRMAFPQIDRRRWIHYCETLARLDGGVIAAAAGDDAIHGLAIYRPEEDLRFGRIVRVDAMVAFELNPANPVRQALCEAVESICDALEARGILLVIAERDAGGSRSSKSRGWESAGFHRQGCTLWKPQGLAGRNAWSEAG